MSNLDRPPKSAAEIKALPSLGTTEGLQHVRENGEIFAPETLVYVMRDALVREDPTLFELAARFLVGRRSGDRWQGGHVERTIAKLAWRLDADLRPDFRSKCLSALFAAIYAGREAKPFWEERFRRAFKMVCVDNARALYRLRQREQEIFHDSDDVDFTEKVTDSRTDHVEDGLVEALSRPEHERVVLTAVRALPERQGQAVMLAWMEGRPIEGHGPHTVAKVMGISTRRVYQLLEAALSRLRANEALRAIACGEA
jgi:DNA-directed RNA polymerase specialized sigma24 family protein